MNNEFCIYFYSHENLWVAAMAKYVIIFALQPIPERQDAQFNGEHFLNQIRWNGETRGPVSMVSPSRDFLAINWMQ